MKDGGLVARRWRPRTLRGWTVLRRDLVADRRVPVRCGARLAKKFGYPDVSGGHRLASSVCGSFVARFRGSRCNGRSQARRRLTVNPSRTLRRFESFTCHHQHKEPLICGNADQGLFCRVRRRPRKSGHLRLTVSYMCPGLLERRSDPTLGQTFLVVEGMGVGPQQAPPRCDRPRRQLGWAGLQPPAS